MILFAHACGQDSEFIDFSGLEVPVHRELVSALIALKSQAETDGLSLGLCSGYRNFERQRIIWNEKASGKRPLLDARGCKLDIGTFDELSLLQAMLRWSALPGLSRHHWGSEVDVVDAQVVAGGYQAQLVPEEYQEGGAFACLARWLDTTINEHSLFFRPYQHTYDIGVAPEAWHLSYRPLAEKFSQALSLPQLEELIQSSDIALKKIILENLDWIYQHYAKRYFDVSDF